MCLGAVTATSNGTSAVPRPLEWGTARPEGRVMHFFPHSFIPHHALVLDLLCVSYPFQVGLLSLHPSLPMKMLNEARWVSVAHLS